MKFNKKNLLHYLILIYLGLLFFILSILSRLRKTKLNIVSLSGHKLIGNLETLYNLGHYKRNSFFYITFDYRYYKFLISNKKNILYGLNPLHLYKYLSSKVIISSHGLLFHRFIKSIFNIKTFYTGHAIKSNDHASILKEQLLFDEVWLYSNFEQDIYLDECNYRGSNLLPVGYPRLDDLHDLFSKKDSIKSDMNLNNNLILYAPTFDRNNKDYKENRFSYNNLNFYKFLDQFGQEYKFKILLKYHIESKLDLSTKEFISLSDSLILVNNKSQYPEIMPLAISDILITDWSSVFVDFLSLSKPTVFLDTPRTYTKSGVSKVFDNKSITRVKNYENLKTQILYSQKDEFRLSNEQNKLKDDIFENKYEKNNTERCCERIDKEI